MRASHSATYLSDQGCEEDRLRAVHDGIGLPQVHDAALHPRRAASVICVTYRTCHTCRTCCTYPTHPTHPTHSLYRTHSTYRICISHVNGGPLHRRPLPVDAPLPRSALRLQAAASGTCRREGQGRQLRLLPRRGLPMGDEQGVGSGGARVCDGAPARATARCDAGHGARPLRAVRRGRGARGGKVMCRGRTVVCRGRVVLQPLVPTNNTGILVFTVTTLCPHWPLQVRLPPPSVDERTHTMRPLMAELRSERALRCCEPPGAKPGAQKTAANGMIPMHVHFKAAAAPCPLQPPPPQQQPQPPQSPAPQQLPAPPTQLQPLQPPPPPPPPPPQQQPQQQQQQGPNQQDPAQRVAPPAQPHQPHDPSPLPPQPTRRAAEFALPAPPPKRTPPPLHEQARAAAYCPLIAATRRTRHCSRPS